MYDVFVNIPASQSASAVGSAFAAEKTRARAHLAYVDGLRALATLFVVISHTWLENYPVLYGQSRAPTGWFGALTAWMLYAHFAVSVFIVISGFCLAMPIARNGRVLSGGALGFYWRRIRRIVPAYYAALAFSLLCIWLWIGHKTGTHWDLGLPVYPQDILFHLAFLQDFLAPGKLNSVFWSISVEFRIYLLFPLFVLIWRTLGAWGLLVVGVLFTFGYYLTIGSTLFANTSLPILDISYTGLATTYIGLFVIGMLSAHLVFSPGRMRSAPANVVLWSIAALVMAGTVIALCILFGGWYTITNWEWAVLDLFVGLFAACLLIGGAQSGRNIVRSFLSWKPLAFIGTFAYSIYLIHFPLEQLIWQYMLHPLHLSTNSTFVIMLVVGTPIILAAAYLFFLIFERPFIHSRAGEKHASTSARAGDVATSHTSTAVAPETPVI